MNIYQHYVLPKMIDMACGTGQVMKARANIVPQATGEVLEIGIGSGLNLEFYDASQVTSIIGIDPAAQMQALADKRAAQMAIPIEIIAADIYEIDAEHARFDTIVMTFTLCSIDDPIPALTEMARLLKPEGRLLFCEHGLAPDASVKRWQRRLTPLWKPMAGGCHLDRDIAALITAGGFTLEELNEEYLPGPKPMSYVYSGSAKKKL
ncbi:MULTISPECIES: class I SAM-dependent methyltransferase [Psychrobacter]|jgi:ubiquinone/menaquinone biosynthesis C-methylase UbiE|uniref:class I SAM-dependent methyltransferase n=1 Tax=Psychrobacter TaxID=497 RepID=UPI0003FF15A6|nr:MULTISPECIES: class I SAM-dependent methyltransferase [Psychrobacter]HAM61231.1 class I SAM-dependent methyltransferase [Psychrobacter sp.]|tara:strand:+ start:1099 stop:1719 length:621 start_codon:yes stop_codon:yes gene_type:complete